MNSIDLSEKTYLVFIFLFIIQLYYFFINFFTTGLFVHYGYSLGIGLILLGILLTHGIIFTALVFIYYGLMNKESWTRKFTIFYLIWASLWALWGLIVGNNMIIHLILLLIYAGIIFYLTTPAAERFFRKFFQYGKYILYTRMVRLKSGLQLPIYFFSKHIPKSGHPTPLPEQYKVEENPRSHMPYLKKKYHPPPCDHRVDNTLSQKMRVIYVVNHTTDKSPQCTWAVRSKNKIISNHRTKQMAIKKARNLARKQQGRVMVQNTNGRFSYGFKPKETRPT